MRPPPDPRELSRELQRRFFEETSQLGHIRTAARAIVVLGDDVLLVRLAHHHREWHFPGGAIEIGETLDGAIRRELAEETTIEIESIAYRFVANNRFEREGYTFHFIEHYFEITPVNRDVTSREDGMLVEWLPRAALAGQIIHPLGVRDLLLRPNWRDTRALEVS